MQGAQMQGRCQGDQAGYLILLREAAMLEHGLGDTRVAHQLEAAARESKLPEPRTDSNSRSSEGCSTGRPPL